MSWCPTFRAALRTLLLAIKILVLADVASLVDWFVRECVPFPSRFLETRLSSSVQNKLQFSQSRTTSQFRSLPEQISPSQCQSAGGNARELGDSVSRNLQGG